MASTPISGIASRLRSSSTITACSSYAGGAATATTEQSRRTALGYPTFRCRACGRLCNERTGTPYNSLQYPTDVVLLVVLWRRRYELGLRDLAEMFLVRGIRQASQ